MSGTGMIIVCFGCIGLGVCISVAIMSINASFLHEIKQWDTQGRQAREQRIQQMEKDIAEGRLVCKTFPGGGRTCTLPSTPPA